MVLFGFAVLVSHIAEEKKVDSERKIVIASAHREKQPVKWANGAKIVTPSAGIQANHCLASKTGIHTL